MPYLQKGYITVLDVLEMVPASRLRPAELAGQTLSGLTLSAVYDVYSVSFSGLEKRITGPPPALRFLDLRQKR